MVLPLFVGDDERLALGGAGRADRGVGVGRGALATATMAHHSALASGLTSLLGGPLVGGALGVGSLTALAGDFALLGSIHRGEPSTFLVVCGLCHSVLLWADMALELTN